MIKHIVNCFRPTPPFEAIKKRLQADPDYAWSWHCNLAMAFMDGGGTSHEQANRGAARFMRRAFDVDVTDFPEWVALEKQWRGEDCCTRPPEGWMCTRDAAHDGPCAALPA